MVLFLDTNVVIDYMSSRPCSKQAKQVINICLKNNFDVYISATTVVNCFYILRKERSVPELREFFINFFEYVNLVGTLKSNILDSLHNSTFTDFEDCVQTETAKTVAADYIITRNKKDFASSEIPTLTPEEFIENPPEI